ncbi:50S ribosomal protein L24e [Halorhabdus rudnickae]|uniref:50S ribosomal protein L24e n=1 Tax=Halorhabdus rudnickae TaxID=1775544 RepID=UPI001084195E|nr:50S ribosomal protein L24e [Halorhabdus rudnickae]
MPQTRECDYCGADIEPGTGTMFVRKNGTTIHFCSSKCEKNADLGREARDLSWTEAGRGTAGEAETVEEDEAEAAEQVEDDSVEVQADEAADQASDDAVEGDKSDDEDADAEEADTEEPTEADA